MVPLSVMRDKMGNSYKRTVIDPKIPLSIIQFVIPAEAGMTNILKKLDSRFYGNDDQKGLSLIEVMIALVILLLVMLALMQTALLSIDSNMINVLRDEAVGIAEMRMNEARNTPFDTLIDTNGTPNSLGSFVAQPDVPRNVRNVDNFIFTVERRIDDKSTDNKQIDITVTWDWKEKTVANGDPNTHTISTILRRQ